jgi:sugar phosphate permease
MDSEPMTGALPDTTITPSLRPTRTRWWILFLISLMYLICYMDRTSISIAAPSISAEFGLSKSQMAIVFSAFAWAYAIGQVPGGWMGDRFGPRIVLTVIMTWWAFTAALNGAARGLASLVTARFLLGVGEAGAFPVANRGMQLWFARSERGRISGVTHSFARLAGVITPFVAGRILLAFGWRAIFYIFGSVGLLWAVGFRLFYRNRPEQHALVNQGELAQIRGRDAEGIIHRLDAGKRPAVPWSNILHSPNMWSLALAYGCFFYGSYFFLTWYPTYMLEYRHLTLKSLGIVGALPLLTAMFGEITGGALADFAYRKTGKLRFSRRVVTAPAMLLAGVFVIPAALADSTLTAVLFLSISSFFLDMVVGPSWAVTMDIGGQFSGTVAALMNMTGALGASISPVVFGYFAAQNSWVAPFFVNAGILLTGTLIWMFLIDPEKSVVETAVSSRTSS